MRTLYWTTANYTNAVLVNALTTGVNYNIQIVDIAGDGKISTGDYFTVTTTAGNTAAGSWTVNWLFTSTGGVICQKTITA